jgi:nitronate monooxygenase
MRDTEGDCSEIVDNYRLLLGRNEYVPIVIGGMGVNISTSELALEACRLGGIGHISDAMVLLVSDRKFGTTFTQAKSEKFRSLRDRLDKTSIRFDLEDLRSAQMMHVGDTMGRKKGSGAVFVNVMEKLTMADPLATLEVRLKAALDAEVDGITLSAGLHTHSLAFLADHPRFRDAKIGIIVSSLRALKIFLRGAQRVGRAPDYIIVEGPLAGGHLGFGPDWQQFDLSQIMGEVAAYLAAEELKIPVIAAGGVFTGGEAAAILAAGASGVQVATRFTVTKECGLPDQVKQKYFASNKEDVIVSSSSPTGYLIRLLAYSPCLHASVKPACEPFGYVLGKEGQCQYLHEYQQMAEDEDGEKLPVKEKMCLCHHFSQYNCYTCGQNAYRLRETSLSKPDGTYQLLTAEHVFRDYQFSCGAQIALPEPETEGAAAQQQLSI